MTQQVRLGDLLGSEMEENYSDFDMTEIRQALDNLREVEAIDLAHAELLQQQTLRCADLLALYLGKLTKTLGYLESKVNSTKNKASLEYQNPDGKTTLDMKKWAADQSPEVDEVQQRLARAKGSKVLLDRYYEITVKAHHHFKDIAQGLRRTVLGYNPTTPVPEGYE